MRFSHKSLKHSKCFTLLIYTLNSLQVGCYKQYTASPHTLSYVQAHRCKHSKSLLKTYTSNNSAFTHYWADSFITPLNKNHEAQELIHSISKYKYNKHPHIQALQSVIAALIAVISQLLATDCLSAQRWILHAHLTPEIRQAAVCLPLHWVLGKAKLCEHSTNYTSDIHICDQNR